ncbi:hypothetical protein DFQ27_003159 [Actinomortierella ambigua]|uniref:DUF7789 domain-containing protein n=1 Tax=Actinomortierella ambigua TaxID=1343610 RepID=A0A9P6U685_9FUNG|nr:hypothetical protein DFQ27_003159 [Actinomortierella ambigua]
MSSQARGAGMGMGMGPADTHFPQQQQYVPDDRYPSTAAAAAAAAPLSSPTSSSYQDAYLQQQHHQQHYSGRQPTPQQRDHLEQQRLHQQRLQEQMNAEDSLRMNLHHQNTHRIARPNGAAGSSKTQDSPTGAQGGNKPPPSYYSYPPPSNDAFSLNNNNNKSSEDVSVAARFRRLYQFPCSTYGKWFMGVFALEAVLVIILQSIIVKMYFDALRPTPYEFAPPGFDTTPLPYLDPRNASRSIPAYLLVFVFANIFQLVLAWDAVRAQNTIQLIAIVIFNLCCFAYSIFEISQSRSALLGDTVQESKIIFFPNNNAEDLANALKPLLVVVVVVFGLTQFIITWLAYQLFQEFGWRIYKKIGADPKKKKMYRFYQIYLVLIKVDLFFFVGFSIQFIFLTLTRQASDPEFIITILVLPLTLVILYVAIYAVRHESHVWMSAFILSMHCGVAYFIFKVIRMYIGEKAANYIGVRNFLTLFATLCLISILATIANAAICFRNFGKGLKSHLVKDGQELQSASSQPGRPMVID